MNTTEKLIDLIGTPFMEFKKLDYSDEQLLDMYEYAFPNRVALLFLSLYKREDWDARLEEKYRVLKKREKDTLDVITRLADKLNKFDKNNYVIFKSIKPYPATPNDTDVIFLGNKKEYKKLNTYMLENGYEFHEWAPQQKTYYDVRGKNKIGKGKKGGTYYIDLYEEISTDYYAYGNKNNLRKFIITKNINGIDVKLLASEPELAIIMFHNVFPERTFQLEHFYVPLYYLSNPEFNIEIFIDFVHDNKMATAIKANISLISILHEKHFGFIPKQLEHLISEFGVDKKEQKLFIRNNYATPFMFSPRIFWKTFLRKTQEFYSFQSLFIQGLKMFNPFFFLDVMRALKNRFSEEGTYHLE